MNERRLGEVLEGHRVMLTAYLTRLVHDLHAAEDLVQEVFAEILSNPGLALRGDDFGAYLRGIARHLASRHFRKLKAGPQITECIEAAWDRPEIDTNPKDRESFLAACRAALRQCLESVPSVWQRLFELRYQMALSYEAIAAESKMNSAAVRMTMTRLRRRLADCVESKIGGPLERSDR